MSADLRPLSLGELLDRTFSNYRAHFWLFVGIMVPPQALIAIWSIVFRSFGRARLLSAATNPARIGASFAALGVNALVLSLIYVIVYSIALGGTACALSAIYLGGTISIGQSYAKMRGKIGRLMGLMLALILILIATYLVVLVAAMIGGFLLAAVAGLLIGRSPVAGVIVVMLIVGFILAALVLAVAWLMRYSVAVPALVLENARIGQSLKRSVFLTRGRLSRIFLTALLMAIINIVAGLVFQSPFLIAIGVAGFKSGLIPTALQVPLAVSAGIGGAVSAPLLMIALTLIYYDGRVRKEAFDLQFMMASLEPSVPSPPADSPAPLPPTAFPAE